MRGSFLTRHIVSTGEMINAYRVLIGKPEEKRQLGRPRS
jgi:hypothetical protein